MGSVACTWVLVVTFLLGVSHAFFSNVRPPCFPGPPYYDSCKEAIDNIKGLLEVMQSLKPNMTYTCPACTSTLSEELIIKLVNALIFTATQNCGFNGKGCGGIPGNNGGVGGNTGVVGGIGNIGNAIGGSTTIISDGGNTSGNGGKTPVVSPPGDGGKTPVVSPPGGGGKTPVVSPPGGGKNSDNPLLNVEALGDEGKLVDVDLAGKPILGVNVGGSGDNSPQTTSGSPSKGPDPDTSSLIDAKVLSKDQLLNLAVGGQSLLGIGLGTSQNKGEPSPSSGSAPGDSQGPVGGVAGTLPQDINNVGGVTNTVLNQGSGVPTNTGGATTPVQMSPDGSPIVNSGNTQNEQNSLNVGTLINQPSSN